MNAKQIQVRHWQKRQQPCPYKNTLEKFWNRAGIKNVDDETILRTFRLEIKHGKESLFARLARTYKPNYSLAACKVVFKK